MRVPSTKIVGLVAACWMLLASLASAVVIVNPDQSENNNQTTAPMPSDSAYSYAAGVPFNNVGTLSWENASATYLGNGWAILCAHESPQINMNEKVTFNGTQYGISQVMPIPNIDLDLIQLSSSPSLPSVLIPSLGQMPANYPVTPTEVVMIGNGYSLTTDPNMSGSPPYAYSDDFGDNYTRYPLTDSNVIRWGTNQIDSGGFMSYTPNGFGSEQVFTTTFSAWNTPSAADQEAQATTGDSGGAVFSQIGGAWYLMGIMEGVYEAGPSGYVYFDLTNNSTVTYNIELASYRGSIVSITGVPEPSGLVLAGIGIGMALVAARRVRRRRVCPQS